LLCSGKDKAVTASYTQSVVKVSHNQLGDKANISELKKPVTGDNLFTEPQSGIRIM